jgi:two-component system chemotaxis response regulator CheB
MIRTLIVDDSAVVRKLLRKILESDPEIEVVGEAGDGAVALERVAELKPDIVTMDIQMPGMDGFEATRQLMANAPLPIVIVSSSYRPSDVDMTFRALNTGALTALEKPPGFADPRHEKLARELVRTVKLMSEILVVRRVSPPSRPVDRPVAKAVPQAKVRIIAMGASTGGPPALRQILSVLSPDLAAPVVVVQHIAAGFTRGLVDWLNNTSKMRVYVATHREYALPGRCYIAPEDFHLNIEKNGHLVLDSSPPERSLRPAVAPLFRSVVRCYGAEAIGVLLTGMGRDGAAELKLMKDQGAMTICQDRESSVVYGMPGEAARIGAATHVLPLSQIAPHINRCACRKDSHDDT